MITMYTKEGKAVKAEVDQAKILLAAGYTYEPPAEGKEEEMPAKGKK